MKSVDINDVQKIELEILSRVDKICKDNNIEYFLDCGTALGAVRHGGFIPWDDDIDIGMTRENYNRFLKVASVELGDNYFLQHSMSEKGCPYLFAKVRKNNTTYMEWCNRKLNIHHGIYIDIFPYDNLPDDVLKGDKFHEKCLFINRLFRYRTTPDRDIKPKMSLKWVIGAVVRRMLHYLTCILPVSFYVHWSNRVFCRYNNIDTKNLACFSYGAKFSFDRKFVQPVKLIQFEGQLFYIPNNVDKYLKALYGNYMELPPFEDRVGHLPYKASIDC